MDQNLDTIRLELELKNAKLQEKENALNNQAEELDAQKEELTSAVEELIKKNNLLSIALDQLNERNHELSQLIYRTSHDLKSPITSVKGLLFLMQQESLNPQMHEYVEMMDKMMHHMTTVLQSVALFNKTVIDEVHYSLVPALDLINKVIGLFRETDGFNDIQFHFDFDHNLVIKTDIELMEAVLKALIQNSIFYRNEAQAEIRIGISTTENLLFFVVEDNGEGMEGEVLEKAFDMFYRGNNKSKGSGLGLYIVKKIIQRLEGTIKLIPKKQGLQVQIQLPIP